MQTLGEVGRTVNLLCKFSTFCLERTQQLSSSPSLLLVYASGYMKTAKQFLFLKYIMQRKLAVKKLVTPKILNIILHMFVSTKPVIIELSLESAEADEM